MEENNENKNIENVQNIQQNVETQGTENVQEKKKKSGNGLIIFLIIVIIAFVGAIGYVSKLILDEKEKNSANNTVTSESKVESKKIDESKPWVYDAEYSNEKELKVIGQSDDGYYDETTKESLKMPFINIDSDDAKTVNDSIKRIFEEAYKEFGENGEYGGKVKIETSYEYYENGNILSVVIEKRYGIVPGGSSTDLYTFNFNIETLKTATLSEMAKACGFNSEEEVTNKIHQWVGRQSEIAKSNPDKVAAQMMGVSDGLYFIDKNNKLNFIYLCAAAGNYFTPAVVEPNKEIGDFYDFDNDENSNSKTAEKTTSQQDYSVFNSYKGRLYKNEDFSTTSDGTKDYCELKFDEGGKPTIKLGYKNDYTADMYLETKEIKNLKSEGAAGTTYVSFDFSANTSGGEITGNAVISFGNVAEDNIFRIDVTANYVTGTKEYKNIEVNPIE